MTKVEASEPDEQIRFQVTLPGYSRNTRRESLQVLLKDLIKQYSEPAAKDIRWAERALAPRKA